MKFENSNWTYTLTLIEMISWYLALSQFLIYPKMKKVRNTESLKPFIDGSKSRNILKAIIRP